MPKTLKTPATLLTRRAKLRAPTLRQGPIHETNGSLFGGMIRFAFATRHNLLIAAGAALVGNRAAGFAGALAGTLALTAATVYQGLAQAGLGNRFDMFHLTSLHVIS